MLYPLEHQNLVSATVCKANKTACNVQFGLYAQLYRGILMIERYLPLCQILPDSIQVTELSVLNLMNLSIKSAHAALSLSLHSIANSIFSGFQCDKRPLFAR